MIKSLFDECFNRTASRSRSISSFPLAVKERIARAMILFPYKMSYDDWYRIQIFASSLKTLEDAVLLIYVSKHRWDLQRTLSSVIRCILNFPDIGYGEVHVWHRRQLREAVERSPVKELFIDDERWGDWMCVEVLERFAPSMAFTLQNDLLIRNMYACVFPKTTGNAEKDKVTIAGSGLVEPVSSLSFVPPCQ